MEVNGVFMVYVWWLFLLYFFGIDKVFLYLRGGDIEFVIGWVNVVFIRRACGME